MALVPCKNCGKTISSSAKQCPHCKFLFNTSSIYTNNGNNDNLNFKTNSKNDLKKMFKALSGLGSSIIIGIIACYVGFSIIIYLMSSAEIDQVKKGKLLHFNNKTIEEAIDGFFDSPSWESGTSNDGKSYVNVRGKIMYMNKEIDAEMQFRMNENKTFEINALEFNGIPQNNLMIIGLLSKMYGVEPKEW